LSEETHKPVRAAVESKPVAIRESTGQNANYQTLKQGKSAQPLDKKCSGRPGKSGCQRQKRTEPGGQKPREQSQRVVAGEGLLSASGRKQNKHQK